MIEILPHLERYNKYTLPYSSHQKQLKGLDITHKTNIRNLKDRENKADWLETQKPEVQHSGEFPESSFCLI